MAQQGPDANPIAVGDARELPAVQAWLQELTRDYVAPDGEPGKAIGLTIGVSTNATRFVGGFGATEIGGATAPSSDALYDIASVTKVYTGYLFARALQNGEVKIDDTLEVTFGELAPTHQGQSITLLDLATHTSGLPNYPDNMPNAGPSNPASGYTVELLEAYLGSSSLAEPPGLSYAYSNLGSGILGHILVASAGEGSFNDLVQREIASTYQLQDTAVVLTAQQRERKLQGYANGEQAPALDIGGPLQGGGALRSSADEVLRFLEGATGRNDPAWEAVIEARRSSPHGMSASTGFLLNIENVDGKTVYSKNGGAPGFSSQIVFTLNPPAAVVLLANTRNTQGLHALGLSILDGVDSAHAGSR